MKRNRRFIIGYRAFFIFLFLLCFCIIDVQVQEQPALADTALGDGNQPIDYGNASRRSASRPTQPPVPQLSSLTLRPAQKSRAVATTLRV